MSVSAPDFVDWTESTRSFEGLAAAFVRSVNLTDVAQPERLSMAPVTPNFFSIIGVQPALGRAFADDREEQVIVLSHGLWQIGFGGSPEILGRSIRLSGEPHTVIGVMPRGFAMPVWSGIELWSPLHFDASWLEHRGRRTLFVLGRLAPGVTRAQASDELAAVQRRLVAAYPKVNEGYTADITPLKQAVVGSSSKTLMILFSAVGLVLLIACSNVANLTLAQGAARQRELAIRTALGAGRLRLVRQLLSESLLIALIGGALGIGLSHATLSLTRGLIPLPRVTEVTLDVRVILFGLGISIFAGLASALVPALAASRPQLREALLGEARGTSEGAKGRRTRNVLVVAEFALTLILAVGAGLLIRSLGHLNGVELGLDPSSVTTARLALPSDRYPCGEDAQAAIQRLVEQLERNPGVQAAHCSDRRREGFSDTFYQNVRA